MSERFEESRSRSPKGCVSRTHFVFAGDWGGASTSQKNVQVADSGLDVFSHLYYKCIACAYCFSIFKMLFFSKKFGSYVVEFESLETGKQCICGYIYEKTPPWERCFSACWEVSQSLEYCKFFAGCVSSGRFEVLCFNPV
mgnify:CR=1 FL=1